MQTCAWKHYGLMHCPFFHFFYVCFGSLYQLVMAFLILKGSYWQKMLNQGKEIFYKFLYSVESYKFFLKSFSLYFWVTKVFYNLNTQSVNVVCLQLWEFPILPYPIVCLEIISRWKFFFNLASHVFHIPRVRINFMVSCVYM